MTRFENPALKEFVSQIGSELTLAEVLIKRDGGGYKLRHVADGVVKAESLRLFKLDEARKLSQYTATGEFRPLKSAPDLQRGWRLVLATDAELETALNMLYPGAVADWFAARAPNPPITSFREFTGRQSGMYRVTAMLTDAKAAEVTRAGCAADRCLKRRRWTVPGLDPDTADGKSIIPCLEPCAILLEAARKAFRATQQEESGGSTDLADGLKMK